jgi:hypothetical protein
LLYLELSWSSRGRFKSLLDPDGDFASENENETAKKKRNAKRTFRNRFRSETAINFKRPCAKAITLTVRV